MAVGDTVQLLANQATGTTLDFRPGANVEWILHNALWVASVDIQMFDGTLLLTWKAAQGGPDGIFGLELRATNTIYPRIKNNDGASKLIYMDGVIAKQ